MSFVAQQLSLLCYKENMQLLAVTDIFGKTKYFWLALQAGPYAQREMQHIADQARQEAEQGNWDMAIELAIKAKQQGELAVIQAERESIAWRNRVLR